jgi:hypothetical protein
LHNLRQIIIYITFIGMESAWLYAVLNAANKAVADRLSVPLLVLTLLISFFLSGSLRFLRWSKPALTALSWGIWPILMLLMIKVQLFPETAFTDTEWLLSIPRAFSHLLVSFEPALMIILSTALLWWLGRRLAYSRADFSAALSEFQFGIAVLVITYFIAYLLNLDQSSSIPIALLFFCLALMGISVSHAQGGAWFNSGRRGQWSIILLFSIGLVLLLGFLVSLIVTPDLVQILINAVKWIWGIIEKIFSFFASLFPKETAPSPVPLPAEPGINAPPDDRMVFSLPEWLGRGFNLVYAVIVVGGIIFAIYRITSDVFKWMRRKASASGGEIESLRGAFRSDLLSWFNRIFSRIFGFIFGSRKKKQARIIRADIASVRQLYFQLLNWAAKKGYPRQKTQTPLEYKNSLDAIIPENQSDLEFITEQYMAARYGYAQTEEENLNMLKRVWEKLKKVDFKKNVETR